MNPVTEKTKVKVLRQVNHRMTQDMKRIKELAEEQLAFCDKQGFKRSKKMERILDLANGTLFYVDCRAADLEDMYRDVPRDQMRLRGVEAIE